MVASLEVSAVPSADPESSSKEVTPTHLESQGWSARIAPPRLLPTALFHLIYKAWAVEISVFPPADLLLLIITLSPSLQDLHTLTFEFSEHRQCQAWEDR